jgi:hypothetical protein
MAKKSRKPNLPQETLQRARQELYGEAVVSRPEVEPAKSDIARPAAPVAGLARVKRREVDLRVEYAYVVSDLKNMAILAAGLMVVLLALSLFI